jgi:hypothetical protein
MKMSSSNWLSGFAVVKSRPFGSSRHLIIDCWVQEWEFVELSIQLLDKQREPIGTCENADGFILCENLKTEMHEKLPFEPPYERAKQIFRDRTLHRVQIKLSISELLYKRASHFVLGIARTVPDIKAAMENAGTLKEMESIQLETERRALKRQDNGSGAMFFLVTPAQATRGIKKLLRMFPRLRWQDSVTSDALANLWTRMFSGRPPLLTTPLFGQEEIRKVVFGAIKFAKRDQFRERTTRSKYQQVDDEILNDVVSPQLHLEDEAPIEVISRQIEIAIGHIAEVAGRNGVGDMLRRRIQGENLSMLADEFGISHRNARVHVSRGRAKLGLCPAK